jgi:hypothetical protein
MFPGAQLVKSLAKLAAILSAVATHHRLPRDSLIEKLFGR